MEKLFISILTVLIILRLPAQDLVKTFNATPALQTTPKGAYTMSTIQQYDNSCSYVDAGKQRNDFSEQVKEAMKPYIAIEENKAQTADAAGSKAATDFSDLNSPEMQAKIAKMSQEEKMKFALEVQKRVQSNQNIQTINTTCQENPALLQAREKVDAAWKKMIDAIVDLKMQHHMLDLQKSCEGICGTEAHPVPDCSKKMEACENKASHEHVTAELKNYSDYIKAFQAALEKTKPEFTSALQKFEAVAKTCTNKDKSASLIAVYGYISALNSMYTDIEKQGAMIIVDAKNNVYTKKEY
jgi:hypothetical protein